MNKKSTFSLLFLLLFSIISFAQLVTEQDTQFRIDTAFSNNFETVVCNETACFPIVSSEVIIDRLNCIQNKVILDYNGYTKGFFDYFLIRKRSYIKTMLERKELYFPIIEAQLAKDSMPDELKYMTIIESGLNTRAQSPAGAVGMWQFMKTTGQMYGITSNWYFEERMDYVKASVAASHFLRDLYKQLGDWRLAIAGYNCGAGNVRKAIRRSGYSKDFWKIYPHLPKETRGYVPQFMAVMYAMKYTNSHSFYADSTQYFPESKYVTINTYFNLDTFSKMTNYCISDLILLNPEIKRNVIIESVDYQLRLPIDIADLFLANEQLYIDSCNVKGTEELNYKTRKYAGNTDGKMVTHYKVKSGDFLAKVASKYKVRVTDLKKWNKLRSNMLHPGQKLKIWKKPSYFKGSAQQQMIKKNLSKNKIHDIPKDKLYIVKSGDSLWKIAMKFNNVSIQQLKNWNTLKSESLKVGQVLKLGQE